MQSIYQQHERAFPSVSAYTIHRDGKHVGKVAFKFPIDGAGRVYCYLHILGAPMVRDFASGGGYDKKSAAFADAAAKLKAFLDGGAHGLDDQSDAFENAWRVSIEPAQYDNGFSWETGLRSRGFEVCQAV